MRIFLFFFTAVLISSCGTRFTVRHFKTEKMPESQVAALYAADGIRIVAIDNEKVNFGSIGGGFDLHLKPGWHRIRVSYFKRGGGSGYITHESAGYGEVRRFFQKGRKYYLGKWRVGRKLVYYIDVYSLKGTMVKGVQPLPEITEKKWSRSNLLTDRDVYEIDGNIVVYFRNVPGNRKDWISIVQYGTPVNVFGDWKYIRGKKEGSLMFTGKSPGKYEVRLYYDWPKGKFRVMDRTVFRVK